VPPGLDEDVIRLISRKKGEPQFMLDWRLQAYRHWLTLREPDWAHVRIAPIDYQSISYFSAPKKKDGPKSLDEVTKLLHYEKLGVPCTSVPAWRASPSTRYSTAFRSPPRSRTARQGRSDLLPVLDAVRDHPALLEQYLGSVVPYTDNFFATLNSAVFTDGSFVYVRRACAARWSCRRTSASTQPTRGSSSAL